jgi:hypothetical protein
MSTLAVSTVAAAGISYLTSIFTRDPLLAFGGYVIFWAFIFVPTYHATDDPLVDIVIVMAASAVFSIMGGATSKLFDVGQLIDVWLTGSGGGPNAREELNIPFLLVGFIAIFFAVFFGVAASRSGAVTDQFWNGLVNLNQTLAILLTVLFAIVALAAIVVSVKQEKMGARFRGIHDWASVVYLVVWLLAITASAVPWYIWADDISDATRGWLAGVVGGIVLAAGLLAGIWYERYRDKNYDYATVVTGSDGVARSVYTRQGRFYSKGDGIGTPWLVGRFVVVVSLFTFTWVVGGYAQAAAAGTTEPVVNLFWSDGLVAYAAVVTVIFIAFYVGLLVCYKWPRQYLGAEEDDRDRRRGQEALLQGTRTDDFSSKRPPVIKEEEAEEKKEGDEENDDTSTELGSGGSEGVDDASTLQISIGTMSARQRRREKSRLPNKALDLSGVRFGHK